MGDGTVIDRRQERLAALYDEIHDYASQRDPEMSRRKPVPRALDSAIVLVAQALGRDTQRVTGLPYVLPGGSLSKGGRTLDRFLASFGYTIDPRVSDRTYAYHTDLLPWFPGRRAGASGDIAPTRDEVAACWRWLEAEIELMSPHAIVALGLPAAKAILAEYAGLVVSRSTPRLKDLVDRTHMGGVSGRELPIFVVHHPSGAFQHPDSGAIYEATGRELSALLEGGVLNRPAL